MRKICIISAGILPIPDVKGGAVERLISMLIEVNEYKHIFDITIITCPDEKAIKEQHLYKYTKFVNLKSFDINYINKLINKIKWHISHYFNIDCYWLNFINSPINRFIFKNRNKFDLFIGECAGTSFCNTASRFIGNKKFVAHLHANILASSIYEKTYGNIISVSHFIMNQYRKNSSLPTERTDTVFNGIATDKFNKKLNDLEKDKIRKDLGLEKDDFVIIFCGRIVKEKGLKELICAIKEIENLKIKLLILGSSNFGLGNFGSYPQEIKEIVSHNRDRIIFTGFINNNDLYKYHQIADIGVVPSIYNDPCPLSLFELITSGLPTIATNAGGMPEIGTNETTIFVSKENIITELKENIIRLYNDKPLREKMSISAKKRSLYFNKERFYDDFCKIINRFINLNYKSSD